MIVVEVVQASKDLDLGQKGRWVVATTLLPVDHLIAHQMQRHCLGQYSTQESQAGNKPHERSIVECHNKLTGRQRCRG